MEWVYVLYSFQFPFSFHFSLYERLKFFSSAVDLGTARCLHFISFPFPFFLSFFSLREIAVGLVRCGFGTCDRFAFYIVYVSLFPFISLSMRDRSWSRQLCLISTFVFFTFSFIHFPFFIPHDRWAHQFLTLRFLKIVFTSPLQFLFSCSPFLLCIKNK